MTRTVKGDFRIRRSFHTNTIAKKVLSVCLCNLIASTDMFSSSAFCILFCTSAWYSMPLPRILLYQSQELQAIITKNEVCVILKSFKTKLEEYNNIKSRQKAYKIRKYNPRIIKRNLKVHFKRIYFNKSERFSDLFSKILPVMSYMLTHFKVYVSHGSKKVTRNCTNASQAIRKKYFFLNLWLKKLNLNRN